MDFFKRLSRGAKFDKDRFYNDAIKIKMVRTADSNEVLGFEPSPQIKPEKILKRKRDETENGDGPTIFNTSSRNECKDAKRRTSQDFPSDTSSSPDHSDKTTTTLPTADTDLGKPKGKGRTKVPRTERDAHRENVNRIRNANRIHIWGSDIPDPVETFELIPNLKDSKLWSNITTTCGYQLPTPIQMQALPILLQGRELLACAPTGSGKTAAFLLPVIMSLGGPKNVGFRAVIVVPSLELATQIYRECRRLAEGTGLKTFMIDKKDLVEEKFKKTSKCDILVTTPNRLIHLLKQEVISVKNVVHLIVDECDHLFEGGFRDQLGFIYSACDSPDIKRAFFSATCAYDVEEFCKTHLENPIILNVGPKNGAVDLVDQELVFAGTEAGKLAAFRDLIRKGVEPPILIFVQSQERAEELFTELVNQGLKVQVIHSGKSKGQRENIVESFRLGKIWILICTAMMSRGCDFPAVKVVVNYDLPQSPIEYIHSIGRTGRAGRLGRAITFFTEDDRDNLRRIAQVLENSGFPVPPYVLHLPKLRKEKASNMKGKFRVPKRESIVRKSKYDMEKKKKRLQMIRQSKAKHDKGKINECDEKTEKKKKKKRKEDKNDVKLRMSSVKGKRNSKDTEKNTKKTKQGVERSTTISSSSSLASKKNKNLSQHQPSRPRHNWKAKNNVKYSSKKKR